MKEVKNKSKHASKTFLQKITDTDDKKNTEVSVFQYVFEIRCISISTLPVKIIGLGQKVLSHLGFKYCSVPWVSRIG